MKNERFGLILVNLLLFSIACFFLSGCMTYKKALRKFGHLANESATIIVRDTVITRKDSVVLSLKTDTTTVHQVIQQGNARVIYDRTHTITTIKGECLPDTVIREIPAKCPPVVSFGVSPRYKTGFFIVLSLIPVLILAFAVFLFRYCFKLSLAKR